MAGNVRFGRGAAGPIGPVGPPGKPWTQVGAVSYVDFQGGSPILSPQNLPQGYSFDGVIFQLTELFTGPGITTYQISMGLLASLERYMPLFEVCNTVIPGTELIQTNAVLDVQSIQSGATNLYFQALTDGNLADAVSGVLGVWVRISEIPVGT